MAKNGASRHYYLKWEERHNEVSGQNELVRRCLSSDRESISFKNICNNSEVSLDQTYISSYSETMDSSFWGQGVDVYHVHPLLKYGAYKVCLKPSRTN